MSRHSTRQLPERTGFALRFHEALGDRTAEDFARELGVTLRTVQRWRSGEGEPAAYQTVVRMAAILGRPVDWFYEDQKDVA